MAGLIDLEVVKRDNGCGMDGVYQWLANLGLVEYSNRFAQNHIDLSILTDLTDEDLRELGVNSLGHRKKILRAIAELRVDGHPLIRESALKELKTHSVQSAAGPNTLSSKYHPVLAERRQVTVMFCDLVGSTAMSAQLDPEDMHDVIGAYQRACVGVVKSYEGFIAKFMGDGILIYFGYPCAHELDAERAIRAGLAIVEAVPKLDTCAPSRLQVRVGIATGLVVVGDIIGAVGTAQEQAVVGETPNLAARLQELADPGSVVVPASTRKLTTGLFHYRDLGSVALKGFSKSVFAWQVLGLSGTQSRFEAQHATGVAALVGREKELGLLLECWQRAQRAEGQVVTLVGEPGIGKSRVALALDEALQDETLERVRYCCSPHHQDSPLYPFIVQLGLTAGFRREDDTTTKLAKLEAVLASAGQGLDKVGVLAELLSVQTRGHSEIAEASPQQRKEQTFEALSSYLFGLAIEEPVLLLFEDVHWIDPSSQELLSLIVDQLSQRRVLLIITARPEFNIPWLNCPHSSVHSLTRLGASDAEMLVQRVAANKPIPESVMQEVLSRTDGVPLFIEELTKTVLEGGYIEAHSGGEILRPLLIPATLQGSLLARLDRLAPVREVAQIGAALGRQFSYELIHAIARMPERKLREALDQLVSAELIFQRGDPPHAEYIFKHALVQDAAYGTLLRTQRQQLHARIASALERRFPEIVAVQPQILAQHCAEAGLSEAAIDWWRKAGELAFGRFALSEAITHLQKALGLAAGLPNGPASQLLRLRIQTTYGQALFHARGQTAPETAAAFARACQLAAEVEDPAERSAAYFGLWASSSVRSEVSSMREVAGAFLRDAQRRPESLEAGVAHRIFGTTCWIQGEYLNARTHLEQALKAYDHQRDKSLAARFGYDAGLMAAYWLAIVLWALGKIDKVSELAEEATSLALQSNHVPTIAHGHWFACFLAALSRRPSHTAIHAEKMLDIGRKHGLPLWVAHGTFYAGWQRWRAGDRDGHEAMRDGLSMLREKNIRFCEPLPKALFAEVEAESGRIDQGLAVLDSQLSENQETEQHWFDAELYRTRGEILLRREPPDDRAAVSAFHKALEIADSQRTRTFKLRSALSLSKHCQKTSRHNVVRDLLISAVSGLSESPLLPEVTEANLLSSADIARTISNPVLFNGRLKWPLS